MSVHSSDLARIAKILARLFPEFDQRQRFASKAEVGAQAQIAGEVVEAWRDIVHCAQVHGTLMVLLQAAVAERPQEKELRRLLESFDGEPRREFGRYIWVAGALLFVGLLSYWMPNDTNKAPGDQDQGVDVFPKQAESQPLAASSQETQTAPSHSEFPPALDGEAAAIGSVETTQPLQPVNGTLASETVDMGAAVLGRCGGEKGTLLGYFYANEGIPAEVGQPYTMKRDVNVRTDYPNSANGWSASADVVCVLQRGDAVRLTSAPFDVDGGKVWVPLHAGDLQR